MHHVIAAEALRAAYQHATETATAMRAQVGRTDLATAHEVAIRLNDGARVQTVVVARLLSELAAAIEDLGAMLLAARHRARRGVMVEYLEAAVPGVANMLDLLLSHRPDQLPDLLNLPDVVGLTELLEDDRLNGLQHDYKNLGAHLA